MDLTNGFVIKIDVQKNGFVPEEPGCYKKAKNIRNIMGSIFISVICPAIRHLENVNKS